MWTRRSFLSRTGGSLLAVGSGALAYHALAQEMLPNGSQAQGMINSTTQDAIDRGLAYLANNQQADGSFGTGRHRGNVAITSLAGLAFMAGGHQPGRGRYGNAVTRAVEYVVSKELQFHQGQRTPGFLHYPTRANNHGPMYGHGFGTLFLAEAHGMIYDRNLRDRVDGTLRRAVQLIITSQNREGGWRYRPVPRDADLSVTICQIMALRAARNAGLSVPRSVADACINYVRECQALNGDGGFRYQRNGGPTGFARTAAGVVALYSAGVYEGPAVERGLEYLMRHYQPNAGGFNQRGMEMHYFYGHYYAAQAMWIAGGRYWETWFPAIRDDLLRLRNPGGAWVDQICTHYGTAMACIILQIPNNYLPIFQR